MDSSVTNAFDHSFPPNLRWDSCCDTSLWCICHQPSCLKMMQAFTCYLLIIAMWFPLSVSRNGIVSSEVMTDIDTYDCSGSITWSILFYTSLARLFLDTLGSVFSRDSMLVCWHLSFWRHPFLSVYSLPYGCLYLIQWLKDPFYLPSISSRWLKSR